MSKKILACILLGQFVLASCASKSKDITATYVSPLQYQNYKCSQISMEMGRVSRKVIEVSGAQDAAATKDAVAMTVGLVVFWPALFLLIGGDRKEELARLKGEYEALESAAIQKNCTELLASLKAARERQAEEEKRKKEQQAQQDDDSDVLGLSPEI